MMMREMKNIKEREKVQPTKNVSSKKSHENHNEKRKSFKVSEPVAISTAFAIARRGGATRETSSHLAG
jgi:hypothetical protein